MRAICKIFVCCIVLATATSTAFAQANSNDTDLSKSQEVISDTLKTIPKVPQSLYYIPYSYPYNPNYLSKQGKLALPSNPLMQRNNTENAMNSIYSTLAKDREREKKLNMAGVIFEAAVFGGVAYQMINSKRLTDRMKEHREAQQKPPVRR